MVEVEYSREFARATRKIKEVTLQHRIRLQMFKIIENPYVGKPLRYNLKGERTVYVKPYRIIYFYDDDIITFLVFEHRDDVYR
ncbi:MAG: type II toxin-antitoxin system RelE family toxin [Candidatus Woesearchaeota archaeon]